MAGQNRRTGWWEAMVLGGALLVGYIAGATSGVPAPAEAGIRKNPQRTAFKSGSERSLEILKQIAGSLAQIEDRVEKIETMMREGHEK